MVPEIRDEDGGATVKVRVSPGASRDRIAGLHGDALKIAVRQPPERGRANAEVARLLAAALGARPGKVEVVSGATARDKRVRFAGWTAAHLAKKVAALLVTLGPR
jgi:uncharacterized protein (TIGR00251 family)